MPRMEGKKEVQNEARDEDSIQIEKGLEGHGHMCGMFSHCSEKLLTMYYQGGNMILRVLYKNYSGC